MKEIIGFFRKRHFLTNFLVIAIFFGGIYSWKITKKEELPDVTFNRIRVSVSYPGASAEDVEYFVTKPTEELLRDIDGIYRITSNSSTGSANINIELEHDIENINETLNEIRNEVNDVDLPDDIIDDPDIRLFKTSKKAIIDIALINKTKHLLDYNSRKELQQYAFTLEDQLIKCKEINSVREKGILKEEIQVKVDPQKLNHYILPLSTVMDEIKNNHIRKPAGSIESPKEPKVTLLSELDNPDKLNKLIVQGGFDGGVIRLKDISNVESAFEKNREIMKVNGHQAIMFNVVKNSSSGIIEALKVTSAEVEKFRQNNLKGTDIDIVLLDDESIDIRNRLSIISMNGIIGFVLILVVLFIFLDIRSGLWVALGIPFTLCFTMTLSSLLGYTINGTTLAAVIIVMGMIVDDAIVVAENISRLQHAGVEKIKAAVDGTGYVLLPIIASIITTCVAFIPLFFFKGRFGEFIKFIPPIIFIVLGASLFESIFILPGHMSISFNLFGEKKNYVRKHWFEYVEKIYAVILNYILRIKIVILLLFVGLFIFSFKLSVEKMKFVMFPNEETREIVFSGKTPDGTDRFSTAVITKKIEDILTDYKGNGFIGFRTEIARSRRGGAVEENTFRIVIEILPKEKRKKSADQLIKELKKKISGIGGLAEIKVRKSRWGQDSGSAIELFIQQNNDKKRNEVVKILKKEMSSDPSIVNVEVDDGFFVPEYRITINQEKIKRLSIDPSDIALTLRAALEGKVLYDFSVDDQKVYVRVTSVDHAKNNIENVLSIPVQNKGNYLVPLRDVVFVEEVNSPNNIFRLNEKRTTIIDADIRKDSALTPLEIAKHMETKFFPEILAKFPSTTLNFGGEILDTLESRKDLINAVVLSLFLIFTVLAILFQSLIKPLIIMLAIPFGITGIILSFYLQDKLVFGFYAAIGALGLSGVVINDSIIMLVKLTKEYKQDKDNKKNRSLIAEISSTRLRSVFLTTVTTVAGVLPTAYGLAGYDAMLAEMMLALSWGLLFGTLITLILIPVIFCLEQDIKFLFKRMCFRNNE